MMNDKSGAMSTSPEIVYEWEREPDQQAFKRIMVESFYQCYQGIPKDVLKINSEIREWLSSYFSDAFFDQIKKRGSPFRLFAAKADRIPAGYALFDLTQFPKQVYLCEMAVDPAFQRKGIGKGLVFSILKQFPETEKIVLITRKANRQSRAFYLSIGFQSSDYMEEGYNPELYMGFKINLNRGGCETPRQRRIDDFKPD